MSESRRVIERLLIQSKLPIEQADNAGISLEVYPSKRTWLAFFNKALLIVGVVALVLSLVFFVAYNWLYMGKIGKFALVEGTLVITIAAYVALSFRQRFKFIRQLLLLVASIITGSLLALFGQVYQTGADTWQLFFAWALLITPWVVIARFAALWLLWLGLINATVLQYIDAAVFFDSDYPYVIRIGTLALINTAVLSLWLVLLHSTTNRRVQGKSSLHWSTYVVGLLSTYFITHFAIIYVIGNISALTASITLLSWVGWCALMYWRFYVRQVDVLMLTFLCFSMITVAMFWAFQILPNTIDVVLFFILTPLLIGMTSYAIAWLRKLANLEHQSFDDNKASMTDEGANHDR